MKLLNPLAQLFGLKTTGKIKYHDVNQKALALSDSMSEQGYHVPVLYDSDVHGRSLLLLQGLDNRLERFVKLGGMGAAGFYTDLEGDCGKELLESMKVWIFSGEYSNFGGEVSVPHFVAAFGLPILFSNKFRNPRASLDLN